MADLHHRSIVCGWEAAPEHGESAPPAWVAPAGITLERYRHGAFELFVAPGTDVWVHDGLLVVVQGRLVGGTDAATPSDARSLGQAWRTRGRELLGHLRGHFAVVVCDRSSGELVLATDWFNTHPLCYATTSAGRVAFATDAQLLTTLPGAPQDLSPAALYHYLYFHMVPTPHSIYAGVRRIEPAHALHRDTRGISVGAYWQPQFTEVAPGGEAALAEQLLAALRVNVRRASRAERCAAFLSGGLDSSTVTGLLAEVAQPTHAYSIGFEAQGYDEMEYARTAARHFGVQHHEYYVTPADVYAALPLIATAYDEPFGNSSAIPAYYCAQLARRDGIDVMLAGDGGDELFGGNVRYAEQKLLGFYQRLPRLMRKAVCESWLLALPGERIAPLRKLQSYVRQAAQRMPDRLERWNYFTRRAPAEILAPNLLAAIDPAAPIELLRTVYSRTAGASLLNSMLALDWKQTLADNDLRKVSRTCSLAGVEVAYPFLGPEVVELSMRVPSALKIRGLTLRHFYKRAMRNFLPQRILTKSKHGFGLPFGPWLARHAPLQELVLDSLATFKQRGVVRAAYVDELVAAHAEQHAGYYGELMYVLTMLELWLSRHRPGFRLT